jgi:carboxymethylenebutenolidase
MRVAKRIAAFVLTALLAALVALAAWIVIDRARTDGRVEAVANARIDGPAGDVHAYRAEPPGEGPHPAVVMIHEFWGLRRDIAGKAAALAEEGYVVVAPDTFRGVSVDSVPAAIWNVVATPRERVNADLRAVVDALAADPAVDPARIVVMGFCYGGGAALRYALRDERLAGTGVFYGTPVDDPDRLAALPGPLLGIFGAEDRQIPVAEVERFEAALARAGVPHEIRVFDGVGHAFVGGIDEIRAGGAPGRAWDVFLAWLDATAGGG